MSSLSVTVRSSRASRRFCKVKAHMAEFVRPPDWSPMPGDETLPADRDASWWARHELVSVDLATAEAVALGALLRRGLRHATVRKLERVQNRVLWARYATARHLVNLREGDANEQLLFHGTCALAPADVCTSDEG